MIFFQKQENRPDGHPSRNVRFLQLPYLFVLFIFALTGVSACSTSYHRAYHQTETGIRREEQGATDEAYHAYCRALYHVRGDLSETRSNAPRKRLLLAVVYHSLERLDAREQFLERGRQCRGLELLHADYGHLYPESGVPLLEFAMREIIILRALVEREEPEDERSWLDVQADVITGDHLFERAGELDVPPSFETADLIPSPVLRALWKWALYATAGQFYAEAWKFFPDVSARTLSGLPQERLRDAFQNQSAQVQRIASRDQMTSSARTFLESRAGQYQERALSIEQHKNMSAAGISPERPFLHLDPANHRKRGRTAISRGQRLLEEGKIKESVDVFFTATRHLLLAVVLGRSAADAKDGYPERSGSSPVPRQLTETSSALRSLGTATLHLYRIFSERKDW